MKRNAILGTAILALACCAQAQTDDSGKCTASTLNGAYGVLLSGTGPAPSVAPGKPGFTGQTQVVVGIVVIVFDGKGNFTQVDNVKGSVAGFTPDRPGKGTYVVNSDCSTIATVQAAPGVTLVTKSVIVDGGKGYFGFTLTPDDSNIIVTGRRIN
jgi:hypothetical protein